MTTDTTRPRPQVPPLTGSQQLRVESWHFHTLAAAWHLELARVQRTYRDQRRAEGQEAWADDWEERAAAEADTAAQHKASADALWSQLTAGA